MRIGRREKSSFPPALGCVRRKLSSSSVLPFLPFSFWENQVIKFHCAITRNKVGVEKGGGGGEGLRALSVSLPRKKKNFVKLTPPPPNPPYFLYLPPPPASALFLLLRRGFLAQGEK